MKKDVVIRMETGMEARPIALLVQIANQYSSQVYLDVEEKHVNAKSIMGMMSLALVNGTTVTISAEGSDEEDVIAAMEQFLTSK